MLCHVQKLLEEGSHLARCAGMNAQPLAGIESVPMLLSIAPGQHEDEEIGVGPVTQHTFAVFLDVPGRAAPLSVIWLVRGTRLAS